MRSASAMQNVSLESLPACAPTMGPPTDPNGGTPPTPRRLLLGRLINDGAKRLLGVTGSLTSESSTPARRPAAVLGRVPR